MINDPPRCRSVPGGGTHTVVFMDVNDAYEMRKKAILEMVKRDEEKKAAEKEWMESFYREQAERNAAMEAEHKRMVEAFFKSHEKRSAKKQASGDDAPATAEEGKEASRAELMDALVALIAAASRPVHRDSCDRDHCLIPLEALKKAELLVPKNVRREIWPKLIYEVAAKLGKREPNISMVQRLCAEFFLGLINLEEGHKPSLDDVHEADYLAQCFHDGKFAEDEALGLMVVSYLIGRLHGDLKRD